MPTILVPAALRAQTDSQDKVHVDGDSIQVVLENLINTYPGLQRYIFSANGELYNFINVYLNGDDVRCLSGLATVVKAEDVIMLLPAIAGG